ncbi:hypothetical protein Tco_0883087 [Tanacetum coccineum]
MYPQLDSCLVVPSFLPTDDLIASINKAMAFISTSFSSRYPLTNNQLRTSSNLRNQATIQDGEGHMARQCTEPKRPKNSEWFKEKILLAQALKTDDLDAFDSDCDEAPSASALLMAKLSAYDLDILSEYSEQPIFVDDLNIEITSDSNVISYEQYMKQNENEVVQDTTSSKQQDAMIRFLSLGWHLEEMHVTWAHLEKKQTRLRTGDIK